MEQGGSFERGPPARGHAARANSGLDKETNGRPKGNFHPSNDPPGPTSLLPPVWHGLLPPFAIRAPTKRCGFHAARNRGISGLPAQSIRNGRGLQVSDAGFIEEFQTSTQWFRQDPEHGVLLYAAVREKILTANPRCRNTFGTWDPIHDISQESAVWLREQHPYLVVPAGLERRTSCKWCGRYP